MLHTMIMAGGKGTRFWPRSRAKHAKQFLSIIGDKPLIQYTLDRITPLTTPKQRWILGNHEQEEHLNQLTDSVPKENILKEPFGKNTAACIGWGAFEAIKQDPDAILVILPADAWITPDDVFQKTLLAAVDHVTHHDDVVTLGIPPTHPHTGYGYIQVNPDTSPILSVTAFKEKPTLEKAKTYLKSSNYYWNAGIFIWKARTVIDCLKTYLPTHHDLLKELVNHPNKDKDTLSSYYDKLDNISIDYGIMEHIHDRIKLIPAPFQWSDIGNWAALEDYLPKDAHNNAVKGSVLSVNSHNNIIISDKKLIACANIDDLIIVDSPDALLIIPKDQDQDVKAIYDKLDDSFK